MKMLSKAIRVVATIVPRSSVHVTKGKGGYEVELRRVWFGVEKGIDIKAKDAVETEINLLDLI